MIEPALTLVLAGAILGWVMLSGPRAGIRHDSRR